MGVKIDGLSKLSNQYFDEIIIEEIDGSFYVKVLGEKNIVLYDDDFSREFQGLSDEMKIMAIVQRFLDTNKVEEVVKSIPLGYRKNNEAIVYSQDGSKKLRMKIYNPKYRVISNMILNNYLSDRYDYFMNEEFNNLILENDRESYGYKRLDDCVKLTLKTDMNSNVLRYEKEFVSDFLLHMFAQIGEKAAFISVVDKPQNTVNGNINKRNIIQCGNMTVSCAVGFTFSFLSSIVNDHNENVEKNKKR